MNFKQVMEKVVEGRDLDGSEASDVMGCIMRGELTPSQIAAFLVAMRMKGESAGEIAAFARTMREFSSRINPRVDGTLVDTCGTGGDRIKTFNISTAAMLVACGAGVPIAKHGNRSVTSKAGSADVLEALGVKIDLAPDDVERCIESIKIGFMFAPIFHPAMRHATPVRREIGIRTVFNILGPLTNPAGVKAQVIGVYDEGLVGKIAEVLRELGCRRAIVCHGVGGLDEMSTISETVVCELEDGEIWKYMLSPEELGLRRSNPSDIAGGNAEDNARILLKVLSGEKGPRRDAVVLNAGAAILVGGFARDLREGIEIAEESIDSGEAIRKLEELVSWKGDPSKLRRLKNA